MVSIVKCSLAVAVMISLACSAYAIKCYNCDSLSTPKCGLKFEADNSLLEDCARLTPRNFQNFFSGRNATGCMKRTLQSNGVGQPQIMRSCYFGDINNIQIGCQMDPPLPFVRQVGCDVCTSEACNGSASLAPVTGAILLLFLGLARLLA